MILVDAAPLIALLYKGDPKRELCFKTLQQVGTPLYTTWSVIAEAMYFLHKYIGWPAQRALWQMIHKRQVVIAEMDVEMVERAYELMEKYADVPMDLADATLCALAENLGCKKIFTLDGDFIIYKFKNRAAFQVVPG